MMKIDTFWIRIIALITMTLDHIGVLLPVFTQLGFDSTPVLILRVLGRIALPLFIFLEIEAIRHTTNPLKYILRIAALAIFMMGAHIITAYCFDSVMFTIRNPMIDILLIAIGFYLLNRKDKISYLSVLPIGFLVFSTILDLVEKYNDTSIQWMPFFLRGEYGLFGVLIALACYYSVRISLIVLKNKYPDIQEEEILNSLDFQYYRNIINIGLQVIVLVIFSILPYININLIGRFETYQSYFALSFIPLLFYNGKLGYKAKWFKYASYFYFPVHIVIIYLILFLITR